MKTAFALSLTAVAILYLLTFSPLTETKSLNCLTPVDVESYTAGDFDQLRIRKTYRLSPSDDPTAIPTEDFELSGRTYHLLALTKGEDARGILYTAVFGDMETPYSNTKEMPIALR